MQQNILITGGAGFIGSHLVNLMVEKYPNYNIINLDKLTYAANIENIKVSDCKNYRFEKVDICDKELVKNIFEKYNINNLIHLAAESHVDNSINSPSEFIQTNIVGTANLLQVAYNFWFKKPQEVKIGYEKSKFLHISTDEVYGSLELDDDPFTEDSNYLPNSPYSASKSASDMLVRSYSETFAMNTNITHCSNNYGPHQHKEKLIPKTIYNALQNKSITVYGNGKNIRDWLFVEDHINALDLIFHQGKSGEVYNIGGGVELENIKIVNIICEKLQKITGKDYKHLIEFTEDRYGHDFRYAINCDKINNQLSYKISKSFEDGIDLTIEHYLNLYR